MIDFLTTKVVFVDYFVRSYVFQGLTFLLFIAMRFSLLSLPNFLSDIFKFEGGRFKLNFIRNRFMNVTIWRD